MKETTVTEALAELKVIDKRIKKKQDFVGQYVLRPEALKDPLAKDGGSVQVIVREMQAIGDLEETKVSIRRAIQKANVENTITIGQSTRTIADWLIWRRDISVGTITFLRTIAAGIDRHRNELLKKGAQLTTPEAATKPTDVVVNIDEAGLSKAIEDLEAIGGTLDGLLSLKNATITIEY